MLSIVLWPLLVAWIASLGWWRHRHNAWVAPVPLVCLLLLATALADAAAVIVSTRWRTPVPVRTALTLVWPALALSLTTYLALHTSSGGGDDPADDSEDPPWWPEFERDFRAYETRRKVGPRAGGRPRVPVA
jgi:hypothetical protein